MHSDGPGRGRANALSLPGWTGFHVGAPNHSERPNAFIAHRPGQRESGRDTAPMDQTKDRLVAAKRYLNWLAEVDDPSVLWANFAYVYAMPPWNKSDRSRERPSDAWCRAALRYAAELIACPDVEALVKRRRGEAAEETT